MVTKAVILCGGPSRGTRFRPLNLSADTPKPLFPIAGKPMIWHQISAISKVKDCTEALLIGFWSEETFAGFVKEMNKEFPHLTTRYLREWQELGTAGGTYHFRDLITKGSPTAFFVIHSDIACSFPLTQLKAFHERHRGVGTIQATRVPRESAGRYGCIVADETALAVHYAEKPESYISDLVSTGVYLFDVSLFAEIKRVIDTRSSVIEPDPFSFSDELVRLEQDVIVPLADQRKLYVYETDAPWRPIKSAGSAIPANALYLVQYQEVSSPLLYKAPGADGPEIVQPVTIDPSATIAPTAKIGPNVAIGPNVVVKDGVRIANSIVLDNTQLEVNSVVLHAIVGARCRLAPWARVEGAPFVSEGSSPKSSIAILASDVTVTRDVSIRSCIVLPNKSLSRSAANEVLL